MIVSAPIIIDFFGGGGIPLFELAFRPQLFWQWGKTGSMPAFSQKCEKSGQKPAKGSTGRRRSGFTGVEAAFLSARFFRLDKMSGGKTFFSIFSKKFSSFGSRHLIKDKKVGRKKSAFTPDKPGLRRPALDSPPFCCLFGHFFQKAGSDRPLAAYQKSWGLAANSNRGISLICFLKKI